MPVASTTSAPGRPAAKRPYHSRFSRVTKPSSVARQGTIAGTHVRLSSSTAPTRTGLNRSERAASAAVGQRVSGIVCLTAGSGCHIESSCERVRLLAQLRAVHPRHLITAAHYRVRLLDYQLHVRCVSL